MKQNSEMSTKQLLGTKLKPEDSFKKGKLIPFLKTIANGYILPYGYMHSGYYSNKKFIPDLFFYHHGQVYAFETKSKDGKCSPGQLLEHKKLVKSGVIVFIPRPANFEAVKLFMLEQCKEQSNERL